MRALPGATAYSGRTRRGPTTVPAGTIPMSTTPDPSILPVGVLGLVAPMNSLGFALSPGLGVLYDEVLVLLPAQSLVFTFQRKRAAEEARSLPYDEAAGRHGIRVFRLDDIRRVELVRPVTGYRLTIEFEDGSEQRWILQREAIPEARRCLSEHLGDRFVDSSV